MSSPVIGIIGGSGLYQMSGLDDVAWRKVDSPFGDASDEVMTASLDGIPLVFLPRHGRGHPLPPDAINYRANIDVLKRCGVTEIVSLSAVGSLREDMEPGDFVIVDQFIDRTNRVKSFFAPGMVAHVSLAHPVCGRMGDLLEASATDLGLRCHRGGTYLVMQGPQFSTLAESQLYRAWGCSVIGMTNMPEAALAREAEMCYATVAMVTDFDCWHPEHDKVSVEQVIKVLSGNADKGRDLVRAVLPRLAARTAPCDRGCHHALEHAVITRPEARDAAVREKLSAVAGRVLGGA